MPPFPQRRSAFTALELAVVLLILAILAGVLVPRVTDRLATARDAERLADVRALRDAIDRFRLEEGRYPAATVAEGEAGYDTSHDGAFLAELVAGGYLQEPAHDPLDGADFHYGYNVFPAGTQGCKGDGPFYVLGIRKFETPAFAALHPGYFKCARKDWSADFEYVTGAGATPK